MGMHRIRSTSSSHNGNFITFQDTIESDLQKPSNNRHTSSKRKRKNSSSSSTWFLARKTVQYLGYDAFKHIFYREGLRGGPSNSSLINLAKILQLQQKELYNKSISILQKEREINMKQHFEENIERNNEKVVRQLQ